MNGIQLNIADVFVQSVLSVFVRKDLHDTINCLHVLNHKNIKRRAALTRSKWSYIELFLEK